MTADLPAGIGSVGRADEQRRPAALRPYAGQVGVAVEALFAERLARMDRIRPTLSSVSRSRAKVSVPPICTERIGCVATARRRRPRGRADQHPRPGGGHLVAFPRRRRRPRAALSRANRRRPRVAASWAWAGPDKARGDRCDRMIKRPVGVLD